MTTAGNAAKLMHRGPFKRDQSTRGESCPEPIAVDRCSHAGTGSGVPPRRRAVARGRGVGLGWRPATFETWLALDLSAKRVAS